MSKKAEKTKYTQDAQNSENKTGGETHSETSLKQMVVFRSAVLAAAVVVILAGIKAASSIITPVLLALFITILLLVPLRWLQSKGIPTLASFGIVGFVVLLLFLAFGSVFTHSLHDFIRNSPKYTDKFVESVEVIENKLQKYGYTLQKNPSPEQAEDQTNDTTAIASPVAESPDLAPQNPLAAQLPATTEDETNSHEMELADNTSDLTSDEMPPMPTSYEKLDPQLLMRWITWGVGQLGHFAENIFLIVIILMFMVFEAAKFPVKLQKAFGGSPITNEHFHKIAEDIRRYIVFKAMSNALSCVTVTIFYFAIGVEYALLWGVIAFFLYFIPNIGALISAIPPLLLIFVDQGLGGAMTLIIGLLIIESVIGYGIEPRLLGHGLGISTVVVFLSLIFWGWLLGPIGLFLAAPLTIVVKIILHAFDETRWVAVLLSDSINVSAKQPRRAK